MDAALLAPGSQTPKQYRITRGAEALPTRYVQGMAVGAVVLGDPTRTVEFQQCFDRPKAPISVGYDNEYVERPARLAVDVPAQLAAARTATDTGTCPEAATDSGRWRP